jgi:hypothetical protein
VLELVAAERLVMFKTLHCQVHVVSGGPSKNRGRGLSAGCPKLQTLSPDATLAPSRDCGTLKSRRARDRLVPRQSTRVMPG